jgi:hypothetical protein
VFIGFIEFIEFIELKQWRVIDYRLLVIGWKGNLPHFISTDQKALIPFEDQDLITNNK